MLRVQPSLPSPPCCLFVLPAPPRLYCSMFANYGNTVCCFCCCSFEGVYVYLEGYRLPTSRAASANRNVRNNTVSDNVNWCMIVWYTQPLRRRGSSFTWHQPCNNQIALGIRWVLKILLKKKKAHCKRIQLLIQNYMQHERKSLVESGGQSFVKVINNKIK